MKSNSPVSRAVNAGKFQDYLMGWVAGITYHDGFEWLLTKEGGWQDLHSERKDCQAHVWPTKEQALAVARKAHGKFPAFVRAYTYSTPTPAHAEGMPLLSSVEDTETVFVK